MALIFITLFISWCIYSRQGVFVPLVDFVKDTSYGPTSVVFTDVGAVRFALIQPYNYYFFQEGTTLGFLLPAAWSTGVTCNEKRAAMFINKNENVIGCTDYSIPTIYRYLSNNHAKIVLSKSVVQMSLVELVNRCIEEGVFGL